LDLKRIQELEDELNGVEEVTEEKLFLQTPQKKYSKDNEWYST
jgi:hypothetical protein